MFSVSDPRIFKIAGRASVVELLLRKVTGKISAFQNSVKNSIMCIGMSEGVADVKCTGCIASKMNS